MSNISLILGGARSGKSLYAENLAGKAGKKKIYLATAAIYDDEMQERIDKHRARRDGSWQTIEEPIEIAKIINPPTTNNQQPTVILVDCLTLWLSNLLHLKMDVTQQIELLTKALKTTKSEVILVSSEVGMGIVPENQLARQFRDHAGIMNQHIAEEADKVVLIVAGIPMIIKE